MIDDRWLLLFTKEQFSEILYFNCSKYLYGIIPFKKGERKMLFLLSIILLGILLLALYFVIKFAVKQAIKESLVTLESSIKKSVKSSLTEYDFDKNNK